MPRGIGAGNEVMTQVSTEDKEKGRKSSNRTIVKWIIRAMVLWTILDLATLWYHFNQSKKVSVSPIDSEQQSSDLVPSDAE